MKLQKQIILDNVDKVKAFVVTVSKYPGDATLVSGRYVVDAKSIMGIFSLDISKPIKLDAHTDNADAFFADIKDFIVE